MLYYNGIEDLGFVGRPKKYYASCLEVFMYKPTTFVWQPSAASLFKITVLSSALAALGITTGCSSTPQSAKTSKTKQVSGAGYLDASSLDSLETYFQQQICVL